MAESEGVPMSRHQFSVAYTGDDRAADHSMSVEALAPALLAFGKLMREANSELNGKKAKANVYVVSDFEHKCFNINFELVIGFYEHLKSLLTSEEAKDAKTVLDWVWLGAGIATPASLSLLGYLGWKRGRRVSEVTSITDADRSGLVSIKVEGDNNAVVVHQHIYNLSINPKALKAARDAFSPIGHDGFSRVDLMENAGITGTISEATVRDIVASCTEGIAQSKEPVTEVDVTPAWLSVYSPVYDESADNWRFRLGTEIIYADISETTISHDALMRGGAMADDTYQVTLEITSEIDDEGNKGRPKYKVLEVIKFYAATPRPTQGDLLAPKKIVEDESDS